MTSPGRLRAMTALLLLAPAPPMLFQGQEFRLIESFHFFADHTPDLAKLVGKGRTKYHGPVPHSGRGENARNCWPNPANPYYVRGVQA